MIDDVLTYQDYYPFGSVMPGRKYTAPDGGYRFGFNGMEKDDEIKGEGNSYTTHFRAYDPRIARWISIDPLRAYFPGESPYSFSNNMPIVGSDPSGAVCIPCLKFVKGALANYGAQVFMNSITDGLDWATAETYLNVDIADVITAGFSEAFDIIPGAGLIGEILEEAIVWNPYDGIFDIKLDNLEQVFDAIKGGATSYVVGKGLDVSFTKAGNVIGDKISNMSKNIDIKIDANIKTKAKDAKIKNSRVTNGRRGKNYADNANKSLNKAKLAKTTSENVKEVANNAKVRYVGSVGSETAKEIGENTGSDVLTPQKRTMTIQEVNIKKKGYEYGKTDGVITTIKTPRGTATLGDDGIYHY
jgi:RHS repeat-associated protein